MTGFILFADGITSAQDLSIWSPASPPAHSIRSLFILVLAITAAIFLLVEGVLILASFVSGDLVPGPTNRRKSMAACPSRSPGRPHRP